jgi:hypothetical protein
MLTDAGSGAERRQLLREVLAGPLRFTPEGRTYRFEGEAAIGRLPAGVAGVATFVVRPEGLEPPAYRFEACRSIQLSYGRIVRINNLQSDVSLPGCTDAKASGSDCSTATRRLPDGGERYLSPL